MILVLLIMQGVKTRVKFDSSFEKAPTKAWRQAPGVLSPRQPARRGHFR
eukprot:COSAG02_NODE_44436_length_366_cov_0.820225_1_plen_48_part_01